MGDRAKWVPERRRKQNLSSTLQRYKCRKTINQFFKYRRKKICLEKKNMYKVTSRKNRHVS